VSWAFARGKALGLTFDMVEIWRGELVLVDVVQGFTAGSVVLFGSPLMKKKILRRRSFKVPTESWNHHSCLWE